MRRELFWDRDFDRKRTAVFRDTIRIWSPFKQMVKAPDIINRLVDDFDRLVESAVPRDFDEASLRLSYINPFWEALGWNLRDPREVIVEKRVFIRDSTKHADYCFSLGGKPRFIVETKDFRKHHPGPLFFGE